MTWLKRLFARLFPGTKRVQKIVARRPTREEINNLPLFEAVGLDDVTTVDCAGSAARALANLSGQSVVGFDTESKPTFVKGEVSAGPHVVQFATLSRTYVFLLHDADSRRAASELICSPTVLKVGFGLDSDRRQIPQRLNVHPQSLVELESLFAKRGYGHGVGVKAGVAIMLKRRFSKSKHASTSNWSQRVLTPKQLLYAANDAYAALRVYQALQKDYAHLAGGGVSIYNMEI